MPLYLSPIIGTGARPTATRGSDPFRPVGWPQQGAGVIHLRPDYTVNAGFGIVYYPTAVVDARLTQLADLPGDTLSLARRTQLGNALGVTLVATDFLAALLDLLTTHARTDGTRWKPLVPALGLYELWLGGLGRIFAAPSLNGGSTFSETWPTNGTNIATGQDQPWTEEVVDLQVVANTLQVVTADRASNEARCTTALTTADHKHTCDYVSQLLASVIYVKVRKPNSATQSYYAMQVDHDLFDTASSTLHVVVAGTDTALVTDNNDPGTSGSVYCQALGSSIAGQAGTGPTLAATDTQVTGNTFIGVLVTANTLTGNSTVDNHVAADVGGPPERTKMGVGTKLYRPALPSLLLGAVMGLAVRNPAMRRRQFMGMRG